MGGPFHKIEVDTMELPMTNNYTISFVEQLTKWVEYFPSDSQKSESIVCLLVDRIICRHGRPEKLEVIGHNYIVSSPRQMG